jgi:hypothetical protein
MKTGEWKRKRQNKDGEQKVVHLCPWMDHQTSFAWSGPDRPRCLMSSLRTRGRKCVWIPTRSLSRIRENDHRIFIQHRQVRAPRSAAPRPSASGAPPPPPSGCASRTEWGAKEVRAGGGDGHGEEGPGWVREVRLWEGAASAADETRGTHVPATGERAKHSRGRRSFSAS